MTVIYLLLLLGAAICFGVAAFAGHVASSHDTGSARARVNFVALGLLLWVLVPLIETLVNLTD